jgi:putative N6-adenine-specific DNA methylase
MITSSDAEPPEEQENEDSSPETGEDTLPEYEFLITCAKGVEPMLGYECDNLGFEDAREGNGSVRIMGSFKDGMRACMWLRTANQVLMVLSRVDCTDAETLYESVKALEVEQWITPEMTLAVRVTGSNDALRHTGFTGQKTKDAIVDRIREKYEGLRPAVDKSKPDVIFHLHISHNRGWFSVSLSGESLHRRKYRFEKVEAPLKESLATAMLIRSEWDQQTTFADPMCGSGTLPIEAAQIARKRPPGMHQRHSFLKFPFFTEEHSTQWKTLCGEAVAGIVRGPIAPIIAIDWNRQALEAAEQNAKSAMVLDDIDFRQGDVRELQLPKGPGTLITNPPYGKRIGTSERSISAFYKKLGDSLEKQRGYTAWVLSGNPDFATLFQLRYEQKVTLFNGSIECGFFQYNF